IEQRVPLLVGQGQQALFKDVQVLLDQAALTTDAKFECIFQNQRQQFRRRLGADDGPTEARRQQPGNAAHVIDVDVGGNQGSDSADVKVDVLTLAAVIRLFTLEQATVDQQAVVGVYMQLVAGTGNPGPCTVVFYTG